jgi:hypothetical protein
MSNLVRHAEYELRRAGYFDEDSDYGGLLGPAVLKMVEAFSEEGHSGYSAKIAVRLFEKLASFEPITPLTGEDDEWFEYTEGRFQNIRCSHVFKDGDGQAYDIEGRIFRDPDGSMWTNGDSRVPVTFPYVPTREVVDREPSNA